MAPHSGTATVQTAGCPSVGTGCRLIAPHTPYPCIIPEFRTECSKQASTTRHSTHHSFSTMDHVEPCVVSAVARPAVVPRVQSILWSLPPSGSSGLWCYESRRCYEPISALCGPTGPALRRQHSTHPDLILTRRCSHGGRLCPEVSIENTRQLRFGAHTEYVEHVALASS